LWAIASHYPSILAPIALEADVHKVFARTTWSALAAALLSAAVAHAGDAWPDGPNKRFFESLQRPDNYKRPYQDEHIKSCCGAGDIVKTQFRVVPAADSSKHPQDAWVAWHKGKWVRIPSEKIVPDYAPDGQADLFIMQVDSEQSDFGPHASDVIICFVRPKGGL
jgi:hypothetical protein